MEEDNPNNVEAVANVDSQDENLDGDEKRPIMLLLKRLIKNKQNTVMTNAQILEILESEFNICVKSIHELEVDIYVKIVKKYLKDWPQWEELERLASKLTLIKDFEAISKVLDHKYKNLKEYLGVMLEAAKPLAQEAVRNVISNSNQPGRPKVDENIESKDLVLEIECTRDQLNNLFFRTPRLDLNNTIFNMSETPSGINSKKLTFAEIINGGLVKFNITLPHFSFVRELSYTLKHKLINKALKDLPTTDVTYSEDLEVDCRNKSKKRRTYSKNLFMQEFSSMLQRCVIRWPDMYWLIQEIVEQIKSEFDETNQVIIPAIYRRCRNNYDYVRYLYTDNEANPDTRYDLQLEERLRPMFTYKVNKVLKSNEITPPWGWLKTECVICKTKIVRTGAASWKAAWEWHFSDYHSNEMDWQCSNCKKLFSIAFLAHNKWLHQC